MPENIGGGLALPIPVEGDTPDVPRDFKALAERLGIILPSAKQIIATTESRENAAYGLLPTADEVTLTIPANALIAVMYKAEWEVSAGAGKGEAAIFIGANQLKTAYYGAPSTQSAFIDPVSKVKYLGSMPSGLACLEGGAGTYSGDVATGQAGLLGINAPVARQGAEAGNIGGGVLGSPCYIDNLPAGTYKISVQYKAEAAQKVTVKNRRLRAWVVF